MSKIKSLADELREELNKKSTQPDKSELPKIETNPIESKTKRKEENKSNQQKSKRKSETDINDISRRINELTFDEEAVEPVTIRFPKKMYSKLRLLGNDKLSIQRVTVYAVNQLLESDEIKSKLKTILKNLNE